MWVSTDCNFNNNSTKTDNFQVKASGPTPPPSPVTICVHKFYDANLDGSHTGDPEIAGWQFQLWADDNLLLVRETPRCMVVDPGTYHVIESTPNESYWFHTTSPNTGTFAVPDDGDPYQVWFGNVCVGGGTNAKTIGFWSNKNGQNLESKDDLCFLNGLCLVNANGSAFDPIAGCPTPTNSQLTAGRSNLSNWLLNANAVNMANMLAAQLTAMELNVRHGFVNGSKVVYAGTCGTTGYNNQFITINALIAAAGAALCADGYTPAGDPNRASQECLKNALDDANNNLNFVQPGPGSCGPFTFPPSAP